MITLYHIIEIILFIPAAFSVGYLFVFSLCSLLPHRKSRMQKDRVNRFLVIFPAYAEDQVIQDSVRTFLEQDYPKERYDVMVISDHMRKETNQTLDSLPITNIVATYAQSSKAKALQLAIKEADSEYDYVVILDADNHVCHNFLSALNAHCCQETIAIQTHRQAKNINTSVAVLDAISEEINNTIFREAHVKAGMSSALIGSGMCFSFPWFCEHVNTLSTSGEDKELEEALLKEGRTIQYLPDIDVYDEKVQSGENFGNQRRRWIAAQIYSAQSLAKLLPQAISGMQIQLIDKFLQQLLLPRSICLVLVPAMTIITVCINTSYAIKWLVAAAMLTLSILIATPRRFYNRQTLKALINLPLLTFKMIANVFHLKGAEKNFIHTQHGID